jgi:hypothetical protein
MLIKIKKMPKPQKKKKKKKKREKERKSDVNSMLRYRVMRSCSVRLDYSANLV